MDSAVVRSKFSPHTRLDCWYDVANSLFGKTLGWPDILGGEICEIRSISE